MNAQDRRLNSAILHSLSASFRHLHATSDLVISFHPIDIAERLEAVAKELEPRLAEATKENAGC